MKIALVGCGLIGGSWGIVFARAGHEVTLFDRSSASIDAALSYAETGSADLASAGLLGGQNPATIMSRLQRADSLERAVGDADYVQESVPERLDVKRAVYEELARLAPPQAILASSTSGFPASAFSENISGRHRCIVAHPVSPPHLLPLVEIVPAPWTDPATVEKTRTLMDAVGQKPIVLGREINGFVLNRLQSAVLAEAFRLVEDGVVGVDDVDAAMTGGLGPRWFFMGPFETIDLNATGGVADYCQKLGPMYRSLADEQADPRSWSDELVTLVERQRRGRLAASDIEERRHWRDRVLARLGAAKRALLNTEAG